MLQHEKVGQLKGIRVRLVTNERFGGYYWRATMSCWGPTAQSAQDAVSSTLAQ